RRHHAVEDPEVGLEIPDVEQDVTRRGRAARGLRAEDLGHARLLGSKASRRPSPTKLTARTARMIARPGKSGHHQLPWAMNASAFDRMLPHVGVEGLMPKPRKLTKASPEMLPPTMSDAATTIGLNAFGRMCLKMIRRSRTPTAFAASTNSRSRMDRKRLRTSRLTPIQLNKPKTTMIDQTLSFAP